MCGVMAGMALGRSYSDKSGLRSVGGVRGVLLNRVCDDHLTRLMIDVGEHIETKRWAFNALRIGCI